jgi:hypothetical protein
MISGIITLFFSLFIGLFGFSQIIYPLFQAWPKARYLQKQGIMEKIPISHFIIPPIIWSTLTIISIWIVDKYFSENIILYLFVLGVMFILVLVQIFRKNPNLDKDFYGSYGKYIKAEYRDKQS